MGEIGLGQRLAADRHRLKIDVRVAVVLRVDRQRLAIGHGQFRLLEQRAADRIFARRRGDRIERSEEHTSELQSLMRISYAVFCLKKKKKKTGEKRINQHKTRIQRTDKPTNRLITNTNIT